MNDPPNPVRKWLRAVRKEFRNADEMTAAAKGLHENTRKLVEREAQEWALEELQRIPARGPKR